MINSFIQYMGLMLFRHFNLRLLNVILAADLVADNQKGAASSSPPCVSVGAKINMLGLGWSFLRESWERASQPSRLKAIAAVTKATLFSPSDGKLKHLQILQI